ncbi:hypothetical protein C7B82_16375 [Stenomitos frigidus ULC18]|uniref:Uncharacterized protein n=2 Tax=Stenomitos TaxID=1844270 RepID=A0A2T1E4G8_9CYAN|nr:hypothetical protein C7B82_16375 [Stenomitos frigidus ULC18]
MAIALAFCIHFLQATPALSAIEPTIQLETPLVQYDTGAIATASQPPKLVPAVLGGKSVYVLYSTRPNDVILVRCYPTYQPSLEVKPMGGQPNQKEGTLTCKPSGAM